MSPIWVIPPLVAVAGLGVLVVLSLELAAAARDVRRAVTKAHDLQASLASLRRALVDTRLSQH